MRRQVLIVQRRLPEYRVPFFERLRALLAADDIRLVLAHGEATPQEQRRRDEGILPWAVRLRNRYATVAGIPVVHQELPRSLRQEKSLVVVTHENGLLSNYPILARRMLGAAPRVAFWGHGPTAGEGFRHRLKRWTARQVDWWFAYTALSVERVTRTGFPGERVTLLNNAVDTRALQAWSASVDEADREALRRCLGIEGAHVAVALGSLSDEKRLPFLVEAADLVRARLPAFHLVVVGDGPRREWLRDAARTRPWMHLVGARHDREKALYCSLGRANLNPGMVGLGIVDSFALGVPMITTEGSFHSPEIAYLEPGRNGVQTAHDPEAFAEAVARVLTDDALRAALVAGCHGSAARYGIDDMARRFADGVRSALEVPPHASVPRPATPPPQREMHDQRRAARTAEPRIAVVWRSFLPYHVSRLLHLRRECARSGIELVAIEVASQNAAYGFPDLGRTLDRHCLFPGSVYQRHSAAELFRAVREKLLELEPDVVFAPATPFPEGMAAISYRNASGARVFMMDDAWSRTDRRGPVVRAVKRWIHRSVDGAFVPAPSHQQHYVSLGFAPDRILFGMDAVDNELYAGWARSARERADEVRARLGLPPRYLLFVGRFIREKDLGTLLAAYDAFRRAVPAAPSLVLAGGTAADLPGGLRLPEGAVALGRRFGEELGALYGLADALVLPSAAESWGLVVNEAMAAGLPALVSRGCGASALVREGLDGWTFAPGDRAALARIMQAVSTLTPEQRGEMGRRAQESIGAWGLDRFAASVLSALDVPRALPARGVSALAARLWRGWVRVY